MRKHFTGHRYRYNSNHWKMFDLPGELNSEEVIEIQNLMVPQLLDVLMEALVPHFLLVVLRYYSSGHCRK